MTIQFKNVPGNLRLPLFYAELDASRANTASRAQRSLLIGQKTGAGTLTADLPVIARSQSESRAAAGAGSILAAMIDAYRAADSFGELWLLPLADDGSGTAATGTITFSGTTTATGTLSLYIAGQRLQLVIASGQTAAQVASTVNTAIAAAIDLPVTSVVNTAVVTLTAKNKGDCGNDIDVRVNYRGTAGGEALPAGLGVAIVAMANGATNPSLTAGLANLLDKEFDFIACSLTDATSLAAIAALLNDTTGRWSWSVQVYGHCWIARRGTAGAVASFATALNNQHLTVIPYNDAPSPPWAWSSAFMGASAVALRADAGLTLQSLTVPGLLPPPLASRYAASARNNTLLYGGCSSWDVDATGTVVIENIVTTYVTNAQGQADDSYLEVEDMYLLPFVLRRMRDVVNTKYARVKLADVGVRLLPGRPVVTTDTIRGDLIAAYRQLEAEGFVQDADAFARDLIVERNATNRNRVDVLWPAILINNLRVFALLAQFRHAA
ncbi:MULTISPECIES: phage tail sheath subtilisin-like domain-containing protein [Sphingomonas]|uniref:phage tail sheath subtilisin-like domain-containing protein n=1 Tax=Sphingomonas TaxID=13687 RepID=UPI00082A1FE6|nr:phage tail sheath subtilisin-like domain-containing protein [Sphingomonas sp. CCH10-B3]